MFKLGFTLAMLSVLLYSCNTTTTDKSVVDSTEASNTVSLPNASAKPQKGTVVPNNLVCMVNDAYMGKQQIEVPFDGKTYYGCCQMCKERIPKDESVRYALEPRTLHKVDKATAYIVLIGDQDEVAYFESKESYEQFYAESKAAQE